MYPDLERVSEDCLKLNENSLGAQKDFEIFRRIPKGGRGLPEMSEDSLKVQKCFEISKMTLESIRGLLEGV